LLDQDEDILREVHLEEAAEEAYRVNAAKALLVSLTRPQLCQLYAKVMHENAPKQFSRLDIIEVLVDATLEGI
jgi:hypothetical protein